jgi:hypothetical protein
MPYEPDQLRFDPCVCASARAYHSVRLPLPMVAVVGASFCNGVKRRRRPKRHETMRKPMERRQGSGNDRRPELATVSSAMPNPPKLSRRALGRFCARSGAGASLRARLPVRFSVPVVAAVGSDFFTRRDRYSTSR